MRKIILALSTGALLLGTAEASAHLRKVHHRRHGLNEISYSVPPWGPYSGYQYYNDGYPEYLSSTRPYLSGHATYQPISNNYADLTFGCCGAPQDTTVTGATLSRSGMGVTGPFGSDWSKE